MKKNVVLLVGILAALAWIAYQLWMGTQNLNIMAAFAVVFILGACVSRVLAPQAEG